MHGDNKSTGHPVFTKEEEERIVELVFKKFAKILAENFTEEWFSVQSNKPTDPMPPVPPGGNG